MTLGSIPDIGMYMVVWMKAYNGSPLSLGTTVRVGLKHLKVVDEW